MVRMFALSAGFLALGVASAYAVFAKADFVHDGEAGFVVSHIEYALAGDAEKTGACADGMTEGYAELGQVFVPSRPEFGRGKEEPDDVYVRRIYGVAFSDTSTKNLCLNPEAGEPNPTFRTVSGRDVVAYGIDLDGQDSRVNASTAPGTCPHDDFVSMDGEGGVDNQFYRVVGCSTSFQSTGSSNLFAIEMLTGSWGILITLSGVDDLRNDDHVEVGLYANADPIQLSPTRKPLEFATYAIDQDPRYRATTVGRIIDGVLTSEPVDLRFLWFVNSMRLDRPLDDARLRLTVSGDGRLEGFLAGYTQVEELYDFKYGFRNGEDGTGELAPLRLRAGSAIGAAHVLGHTCEGAYFSLYEHADAYPNAETGKCTAVSTQYRIEAIPAFVVDIESGGANDELNGARADNY